MSKLLNKIYFSVFQNYAFILAVVNHDLFLKSDLYQSLSVAIWENKASFPKHRFEHPFSSDKLKIMGFGSIFDLLFAHFISAKDWILVYSQQKTPVELSALQLFLCPTENIHYF